MDDQDRWMIRTGQADRIGHMCDTFLHTRCNFSSDRFIESSLLMREVEQHFYQTSGFVPWVNIKDNRPLHYKQSKYILLQYLLPRVKALGCRLSGGYRDSNDRMFEPSYITGMNVNFH